MWKLNNMMLSGELIELVLHIYFAIAWREEFTWDNQPSRRTWITGLGSQIFPEGDVANYSILDTHQ